MPPTPLIPSDMLYHVKRTFRTLIPNNAVPGTKVLIDGTYADLESAKAAALHSSFSPSTQAPGHLLEGQVHQHHNPTQQLHNHDFDGADNGITLLGRTPNGDTIMTVEIDRTENVWALVPTCSPPSSSSSSSSSPPHPTSRITVPLFFIMQTTVEPGLSSDSADLAAQTVQSAMRGVYRTRDEAVRRALEVLLVGEDPWVVREDYRVYEVDEQGGVGGGSARKEAVVHAVDREGRDVWVEVVEGR
ncbi:hypothetical protein MPH_07467 [Macrophomina phaseolina MS6]|uniref:Uncharacterized protein n=1 Tax=Macrophomina phaseolina (strain MS6) TaxID=1126212 RepID=K2RYR1_MACPH|nr:hypothetical protein MPH_07467 [Macrophomina phaseolina MS6]